MLPRILAMRFSQSRGKVSTKFYVTASLITMGVCGTPSVALCQPDSPGFVTSKSMSIVDAMPKEHQLLTRTELFSSKITLDDEPMEEEDQDNLTTNAFQQMASLNPVNKELSGERVPMPAFAREAISHAMRLGSGGMLGFCSGYALKKTSKSAALIFGAGFVALQTLQHQGWIEIKWHVIQQSVETKLDQNGDGKFCEQDAEILWQKMVSSLTQGLGCATGFVPGLLMGLKYG